MESVLLRSETRASLTLILLLVLGAVLAPSTLQPASIVGLLPFAAILAIAALGQHLVIQQGGLDISVAGIFSLAAVIVSAVHTGVGGPVGIAVVVALALAAGAGIGLLNGLTIKFMGVPPLVVTIAVNSVAFGMVLALSGGTPVAVAASIGAFSLGKTVGIPNPVVVALLLIAAVTFLASRTTSGRRFKVTGLNSRVGFALGYPTGTLRVGAYVAAGVLFSIAGVMFAGLSDVPTLFAGNDYMLASVAAYIVGGNSLTGERASTIATAIGALFLTYLGQLVISLGLNTSAQYMIQAAIVLLGVGLPQLSKLKYA